MLFSFIEKFKLYVKSIFVATLVQYVWFLFDIIGFNMFGFACLFECGV